MERFKRLESVEFVPPLDSGGEVGGKSGGKVGGGADCEATRATGAGSALPLSTALALTNA